VGGFYVDIDNIPVWVRWLRYFSFLKYSYDALIINEFEFRKFANNVNVTTRFDDPANFSAEFIPGGSIIDASQVNVDTIWENIFILLGFAVFYRILAFFFLRHTYRQKT